MCVERGLCRAPIGTRQSRGCEVDLHRVGLTPPAVRGSGYPQTSERAAIPPRKGRRTGNGACPPRATVLALPSAELARLIRYHSVVSLGFSAGIMPGGPTFSGISPVSDSRKAIRS